MHQTRDSLGDRVPPNCRFEVDDFELEWTYKKESFDFIHARNICHSVKTWSTLLGEVMSHLKPGAWFELAELGIRAFSDDNSRPEDWAPNQSFNLAVKALGKLGRIVPTAEWLEKLLVDAGFVEVEASDSSTIKMFKHPLMPWPKNKDLKQAGALVTLMSETGYHAYMMSLLTRVLDWSSEDADAFCKKAYAAHCEPRSPVHAYTKFFIGYGRKPE